MKKNKIAFTLVELIVVSLIIILLSSGSVFYFFRFTDGRELTIYTDILTDRIEELDKQVKNFQISDYEIAFEAGNLHYIGNINMLGVDRIMTLDFDNGALEITGGLATETWNYTIFSEDKEVINKIAPADTLQNYSFTEGKSYEISGYLDGESINSLFIDYIAPQDNGIELVSGDGVLSNKNNIVSTTPDPLSLVFEKSGQQHTITLP